nr:14706_t:CDS:2 [Entrophospora candida]CAG8482756.1 13239_t:CDS:2 [Entrophospora candida]
MKHLFSKNHQVLHEEAGYLFSTITHQTENVLSKDIIENIIADGGLKGYSKKQDGQLPGNDLHQFGDVKILEQNPEIYLGIEFFKDVEEHIKVVQPVKETIIALEFRIMSLTDCFIQLTKFSMARQEKVLKLDIFRQICHTTISFWVEVADDYFLS